MDVLTKILTTIGLKLSKYKFNSTPAGNRLMNGISSARNVNSLWERFKPTTME